MPKISVVMVKPGQRAYCDCLDNTLESLQKAVEGDIEAFYPFREDVCIICNDIGKLNGMPPCRALCDENGSLLDILYGPFFLCGCSGEDFSSLSEKQLERYTNLFLYPEYFLQAGEDLIVQKHDSESGGQILTEIKF